MKSRSFVVTIVIMVSLVKRKHHLSSSFVLLRVFRNSHSTPLNIHSKQYSSSTMQQHKHRPALSCTSSSSSSSTPPGPTTTTTTTTTATSSQRKHTFSVAPMMEYTDTHMRRLYRMLSKESVLYTEMITTNTLVRTDEPERYLQADFSIEEPLVLQLGGSDPESMKSASRLARDYGYQEININAGCPSEKVSGAGCFGAALMLQPELLSELALNVGEVLGKPATVKCRIGVNDEDSYEGLVKFVDYVSQKGKVEHFIVHARKAVLGAKFSPDMNRKIPPLKYHYVYRLLRDFPHLQFTINGGVQTLSEVQQQLAQGVHGVMVGRAIVNTPFHWRHTDTVLYGTAHDPDFSRREMLVAYAAYAGQQEREIGRRIRSVLIKPVLQLFAGEPRGRLFRTQVDTLMRRADLGISDVILQAAECLQPWVLDRRARDRDGDGVGKMNVEEGPVDGKEDDDGGPLWSSISPSSSSSNNSSSSMPSSAAVGMTTTLTAAAAATSTSV